MTDAKSLFLAALELPAAERSAHLERACGGDAALRHRVQALLAAHAAAGSFLACPPMPTADNPLAQPGDRHERAAQGEGSA